MREGNIKVVVAALVGLTPGDRFFIMINDLFSADATTMMSIKQNNGRLKEGDGP
jgi:hypothetical protein